MAFSAFYYRITCIQGGLCSVPVALFAQRAPRRFRGWRTAMKQNGKIFRVNGFDVFADLLKYRANNQLAIELYVADTEHNQNSGNASFIGHPFLTPSVCVTGHQFSDNETAIKDYSENEGILDILVEAGIVNNSGKSIPTGHASVCLVTVNEDVCNTAY